MSRTFVVDGIQGLIANVSSNLEKKPSVTGLVNSNFDDSSIRPEVHLPRLENVITSSDVEFTEFFKDYFDSPASSNQRESNPLVPPKGYLQYPEMLHSASDHGYCNHLKESQFEVDYLHQVELKPVLRRGRGRPSRLKKESEMKMEKPKKRIRVVDINKTVFTYPHIIAMALMNFKNEIGTAQMIYAFAKYHFPEISGNKSWTNTLRHALSDYKFFARVENVSNSLRRASYWTFIAVRREELIQQIHKTIDENEYSLEKLKMGNTDNLSSILKGTFVLPYDVMPFVRAVPLVKNKVEEVVQQIPNVHFLPQQYYAPVADPMVALNYSNQYQPAHQQVQYFQQGYNMQGNSYNQYAYNNYAPYPQQPMEYHVTDEPMQRHNPTYLKFYGSCPRVMSSFVIEKKTFSFLNQFGSNLVLG